MGNILRASASAIITAVSSVSALLILLVSTRSGQLLSIAGFSAGMAASAIVAALIGAGTSLSFANGDNPTKSAVVAVRLKLIFPALIVCGILTAIAYSLMGELGIVTVLCGAASVALNNLSELEVSHLKSELRTVEVLVATIISRGVGIVVAIVGQFHWAMLVTAAVYLALLIPLSRRSGSFPSVSKRGPVADVRRAVRIPFLGATILESLNARLPFLIAASPLVLASMPELASLLSMQQGVAAALIAVLFTTMVFRSGSTLTPRWMRIAEKLTVWFSLAIAMVLGAFTEPILLLVGLTPTETSTASWLLLVAAIPFAVWNRKMQYNEYSSDSGKLFVRRLALVFVGVVTVCILGIVTMDARFIAGAWLMGEVIGALYSLVILRQSTRLPGTSAHPS